jgi:hypothetical protein
MQMETNQIDTLKHSTSVNGSDRSSSRSVEAIFSRNHLTSYEGIYIVNLDTITYIFNLYFI